MYLRTVSSITVLAFSLALGIAAQATPQVSGGQEGKNLDGAVAAITDWRVPIHVESSEGNKATPEFWAAGNDYKASFHNGFTFYPVLEPTAPKNLPFAWKTVAVTAGGRSLLADGDSSRHSHSDWRYEYGYAQFKESYEVIEKGVEQSFTIYERPGQAGDLVVTGLIETELEAEPRTGSHGGIIFRDVSGRDILEYGAAFAIDADGRRAKIDSSFDGRRISLTVPAAWLHDAAFPVVIDPMTSTKLAILTGLNISDMDLIREDTSTTSNVMLAITRMVSGIDHDSYGYLLDDDFSNPRLVYTRTGVADSRFLRPAFAGSTGRWVLGFTENIKSSTGSTPVKAMAYFHDRANIRLNSGLHVEVPNPSTASIIRVIMGGARFGTQVLMVLHVNTSYTHEIYGVVIDAVAQKAVRASKLWGFTSFEIAYTPWVNAAAYNDSDGWLITWLVGLPSGMSFQAYSVLGVRAYVTGAKSGVKILDSGNAIISRAMPSSSIVDGQQGKYMIAYRVDNNQICLRRIDWPGGTASPKLGMIRKITHGSLAYYDEGLYDLAFDTDTQSHWVLVHEEVIPNRPTAVWVRRLGHTGGIVETSVSTSTSLVSRPVVAYDDDHKDFLVGFDGTFGSVKGVIGATLMHDTKVGTTAYGTGCGGGVISAPTPYAGKGDWPVRLVLGAPSAPAVFLVSLKSASVPIGGGCYANVDLTTGLILFHSLDALGTATIPLALADYPKAYIGDAYFQWAYVNNGQLLTTKGFQVRIRP